MLRIVIFILSLVSAQAVPPPAGAHDTVWPGEKLQKLMPEAVSFEQRNVFLSKSQQGSIEQRLPGPLPEEDLKPSIYLSVTRDPGDGTLRRTGAIVFIDVQGPEGLIELGVMVGSDGTLKKVGIFDQKSTDVPVPDSFLGRLAGMGHDQELPPLDGAHLTPVEQRTFEAVAKGARRGMLLINAIFSR